MALTAPTNDLTGNTIASTYDQLLILDNAAGIVENTLKIVSTQLGRSALQLDDEKVLIKGVDTSNAAAFEVQQTGGTSIFKIASDTPVATLIGALTVGSAGSGHDVTFYSGTSGDQMVWDSSEEVLNITGTDGQTSLDVLDGDLRVVDKIYLYDRGGEYISSNGTALTLNSGEDINLTCATGDVNIPVNIGLRFGDGNQHIETDNTDLTITSDVSINLSSPQVDLLVDTNFVTTGGVNGMSIDGTTLSIDGANNRVGIGTAAPTGTLTIINTNSTSTGVTNTESDFPLVLRNNTALSAKFTGIAFIVNSEVDADEDSIGAAITCQRDASASADTSLYDSNLLFLTNNGGDDGNTERMRIDHEGYVGIGTSTPDYELHVFDSSGNAYIKVDSQNDGESGLILAEADTNKWILENDGNGGDTLDVIDVADSSNVHVHLATTGTAWVENSDERIKKNIVNVGSVLDSVNQLRPVTYKRKYSDHDKTYVGLIAQEVKVQFPIVVDGDENDFVELTPTEENPRKFKGAMGIEYTTLIPYLIKSIQELSAKVTALENA